MRNCNSHKTITQAGNVLIYVLIGILLIGALTLTLSRQADQSDALDLSDETLELYALEMSEYAQAAQNVITQMEITGTSFSEFDFINPSSGAFNTAPNIHKIFHPQGGGLTYKDANNFADAIFLSTTGWVFSNNSNVEWTQSSADDIIFTAMDISLEMCNAINAKIRDDISAPPTATATITSLFSESGTTDLTTTNCAANCEGYPSLCIQGSGGDYAFYNILVNR